MNIAPWQIAMARRPPPDVSSFVRGSTPVISFGDVLQAEVATIGINPSRREFDDAGWLRGSDRRLATLESLDVSTNAPVTDIHARQIVADCNAYFERNPYWRWFRPLNELLTNAVGADYQSGTACHLDLVQWATDPVWGKMTDSAERVVLMDEGRPHLETLLRESNVHLVFAAGRAVVQQLGHLGVVMWEEVDRIPMANTTCALFRGSGDGVSFVGWSSNLQSQAGANSAEFRARLAGEIRALAAPVLTAEPESEAEVLVTPDYLELDSSGHLPRGLRVTGKREFADTLGRWYEAGAAATVGDVGRFGGRRCVVVDLGDRQAVLNVDTKRPAVASYLEHVGQHGPDAPWRVVANTRGSINKVMFSDDPADAAGWYLYLRKPLATPGEV